MKEKEFEIQILKFYIFLSIMKQLRAVLDNIDVSDKRTIC